MSNTRYITCVVLLLWIAAVCQFSVAPRIAIFGAGPDFLLAAVACLALFKPRRSGAWVGFAAGVLHGGVAGANLAAYAISRTFAGFLIGWLGMMDLEKSPVVAFFAAATATIIGQLILLFGAPPPAILPFLLATIGTAMYNGVIAVPVFALLRRILNPPQR